MRQGFTLIQISILLIVASLVLVTMLPSTHTNLSSNNTTTIKLNNVLAALREYQATNGALPCPADASQPIGSTNYGIAAAGRGTTNNCGGGSPAADYTDSTNNIAIGMVPVRALGLSNDYALDGYGRHITYAVDTNATVCGWPTSSLPGQIAVLDNGTLNNTVAALVSHGADGHGAWIPLTGTSAGSATRLNAGSTDTDQHTVNAHGLISGGNYTFPANYASIDSLVLSAEGINATFVKKVPTATFDDLVVYKSPLWNINALPPTAPQIVAVTPPANGTYASGQVLTFTLTYNAIVTVNTAGGTPYLSLSAITGSVGTGNVAQATYQSGSGTPSLTFSYTIVGGDSAPNGLTMAPSITLNGGTIQSANFCPVTGFTAPNLSQVTIAPPQNIYVADTYNNRVEIFNSSGTYVSQFGTGGTGDGQFSGPTGIAIDASNNVWLVDLGNARLQKFNSTGTYITQFGSPGSGNGQFNWPISAAFDSSGNIWVLDGYNARVQEFNSSGTYITQFGSNGFGNGQFGINPSSGANSIAQALAIDASNNIFVADTYNNRVEEFNSSGTYVRQFGSGGSGNGQFNAPKGIAIDASGNVWVADLGDCRVQEFSNTGSYIGQFGSCGSGNGQFNWPTSVAIDGSGNVWVIDGNNARVQEFSNTGTYIMQTAGGGWPGGSGNGQFGMNPSTSQTGIPEGMAIGR